MIKLAAGLRPIGDVRKYQVPSSLVGTIHSATSMDVICTLHGRDEICQGIPGDSGTDRVVSSISV